MPNREESHVPKMPAMPGRPRTLDTFTVEIDSDTLLTLRVLLAGNQPRIIKIGGSNPKARHFGVCYDMATDSRLQVACTLTSTNASSTKKRSPAKATKPAKASKTKKASKRAKSKSKLKGVITHDEANKPIIIKR